MSPTPTTKRVETCTPPTTPCPPPSRRPPPPPPPPPHPRRAAPPPRDPRRSPWRRSSARRDAPPQAAPAAALCCAADGHPRHLGGQCRNAGHGQEPGDRRQRRRLDDHQLLADLRQPAAARRTRR